MDVEQMAALLRSPAWISFSGRMSGSQDYAAYRACVRDLLESSTVLAMDAFPQHGCVTCLEHCFFVSFHSYRICRLLGLDCRAAARGGLLHDLFLYDWHDGASHDGLHAFSHPAAALRHACSEFILSDREKDIIVKHMWPLTIILPCYPESLVVSFVDKFCAVAEVFRRRHASYL